VTVDAHEAVRLYESWPERGEVVDGRRLTIMADPTRVPPEQRVEVLHVVEILEPGRELYIMGPKPVYGEYVDDRLATEPPPGGEDPLVPLLYDGATLPSPGVDGNYEITSYAFADPGRHEIQWRLDGLRSNVLVVEVVE